MSRHQIRLEPRAALLGLGAVIALVLLIAAIAGGGDSAPRGSPQRAPAAPDASLERQLDALDRAVRDARAP